MRLFQNPVNWRFLQLTRRIAWRINHLSAFAVQNPLTGKHRKSAPISPEVNVNTKATAKTAPKNATKAAAPKAAKAAPRARKAKPEVSDPIPTKIVQKREFLDRVVAASGAKKNDARVIVEATLAELGKAFAAGESLAVQPFGKARVNRQKDVGGGEVLILRLRRKADSADA